MLPALAYETRHSGFDAKDDVSPLPATIRIKRLSAPLRQTAQVLWERFRTLDVQVNTTSDNAERDLLAAMPILDGQQEGLRRMVSMLVGDLKNEFQASSPIAANPFTLRFVNQDRSDRLAQIAPSDYAGRIVIVPVHGATSLHASLRGEADIRRVDEWLDDVRERFVLVANPSAASMAQSQLESYRATLRVLNQAMADAMGSLAAQTALVGLHSAMQNMAHSLNDYQRSAALKADTAVIASPKALTHEATAILRDAAQVERQLRVQSGNMTLSGSLRLSLRSGLEQLEKIRTEAPVVAPRAASIIIPRAQPASPQKHVSGANLGRDSGTPATSRIAPSALSPLAAPPPLKQASALPVAASAEGGRTAFAITSPQGVNVASFQGTLPAKEGPAIGNPVVLPQRVQASAVPSIQTTQVAAHGAEAVVSMALPHGRLITPNAAASAEIVQQNPLSFSLPRIMSGNTSVQKLAANDPVVVRHAETLGAMFTAITPPASTQQQIIPATIFVKEGPAIGNSVVLPQRVQGSTVPPIQTTRVAAQGAEAVVVMALPHGRVTTPNAAATAEIVEQNSLSFSLPRIMSENASVQKLPANDPVVVRPAEMLGAMFTAIAPPTSTPQQIIPATLFVAAEATSNTRPSVPPQTSPPIVAPLATHGDKTVFTMPERGGVETALAAEPVVSVSPAPSMALNRTTNVEAVAMPLRTDSAPMAAMPRTQAPSSPVSPSGEVVSREAVSLGLPAPSALQERDIIIPEGHRAASSSAPSSLQHPLTPVAAPAAAITRIFATVLPSEAKARGSVPVVSREVSLPPQNSAPAAREPSAAAIIPPVTKSGGQTTATLSGLPPSSAEKVRGEFKAAAKGACAGCGGGNCAACTRGHLSTAQINAINAALKAKFG